jgi:hypothetical protein
LTLSPRYDYANTTKTQSVITNGSRQSSVEHWRQAQISDERAKLILYAASVDGKLKAPKSLLQEVHRLYFEPHTRNSRDAQCGVCPNAFTSAFKKLDPIPQFKATAKLGEFLSQLPA